MKMQVNINTGRHSFIALSWRYYSEDKATQKKLERLRDVSFKRVRLVIEALHPGFKYDDTCISLIYPWAVRADTY